MKEAVFSSEASIAILDKSIYLLPSSQTKECSEALVPQASFAFLNGTSRAPPALSRTLSPGV